MVCGTELCVSDIMRMRVLMVAEEGEEGGDKGGIGIFKEASSRIVVLYDVKVVKILNSLRRMYL